MMSNTYIVRLFEHNNWANSQIIQACMSLNDEQLDAEPKSATAGSIRETVLHLVSAQKAYLSLLTLPVEARQRVPLEFAELLESDQKSGEALLALVRDEPDEIFNTRLQTRDGYYVEPWVIIVQIINHASEHREQICSMLTELGVTPPRMDGWTYGDFTGDLVPMST
jgi:uncharacterized damage-inducible protein DinB